MKEKGDDNIRNQNIKTLMLLQSRKGIINRRILYNKKLFGLIKSLLHDCFGNLTIYSPRNIKFLSSEALGKNYFSWGNKSPYFPYHNAINA